jgi:hypothetical protein
MLFELQFLCKMWVQCELYFLSDMLPCPLFQNIQFFPRPFKFFTQIYFRSLSYSAKPSDIQVFVQPPPSWMPTCRLSSFLLFLFLPTRSGFQCRRNRGGHISNFSSRSGPKNLEIVTQKRVQIVRVWSSYANPEHKEGRKTSDKKLFSGQQGGGGEKQNIKFRSCHCIPAK